MLPAYFLQCRPTRLPFENLDDDDDDEDDDDGDDNDYDFDDTVMMIMMTLVSVYGNLIGPM